jgi:CRISPR locus-related DNA-binding protein
MVAVFGMLGFHPGSLIPTIKSSAEVSRVLVFISPRPESQEAADQVQKYCSALSIQFDRVIIPDAYDLLSIAERIQDEVLTSRQRDELVMFNIAGGTRVMSSAALLVCILEGLNAVYVHDDTGQEIMLPSLHMRYSNVLTDMEKEVLGFLLRNRGRELSQKDIAEGMGLHKATVNHHVKMLVEKGAVRLVPQLKDNRTKVVKVEESMRLLLR